MRSLQLLLRRSWDHHDDSVLVRWDSECRRDLKWWLSRSRLEEGVSLSQVSPNLNIWSDASDVGRGSHLGPLDQCQRASGSGEGSASFCSSVGRLDCSSVRGQLDCCILPAQAGGNSFSSVKLHRAEDPLVDRVCSSCSCSPVYHGEEQCLSGCSVQAQSDSGLRVDSEAGSLLGSMETLAVDDRPVCHLVESPMFSIFFTLPRSECLGYGRSSSELGWLSGVCLSTLIPDSPGSEEAPLIFWGPYDSHCSIVASEALVPRASGAVGGWPSSAPSISQSAQTVPFPPSSSRDIQAVPSCVETHQRFARSQGFSSLVAKQVGLAHRPSSRAGYQAEWSIYRRWCHSEGHSVSRPTLPKVADFLFWLRRSRKLSVSAILGYRFMLAAVFRFKLLEISTSPVLHDLVRSFKVEVPVWSVRPPVWDLEVVLRYLHLSAFEPLSGLSLHFLTKKVLFLVSLVTAKRVSELQALSSFVLFSTSGVCLAYVPEFVAKTESVVNSLPHSFVVQSLNDFAVGLDEELLLCPVRARREYLKRTASIINRPRRLFVYPRSPSRAMSKDGISFLLREVIFESGASSEEGATVRAHSIRGIATSSAFFKNWSIASILDAASCQSNSVFTSFYFKDLKFVYEGLRSLGPFVAAGEQIG